MVRLDKCVTRLFACGAVLLVCAGCPTGDYSERYENQLKHWSEGSPYVALYGALTVPAGPLKDGVDAPTPFSIRIPRLFGACYQINSDHEDDVLKDSHGVDVKEKDGSIVKLISMYRLQPPMLLPEGLPDLWRCYEGKFTSAQQRRDYPYYCYLACGPVDAGFAARMGMLRAKLASVVPETSKDWVTFKITKEGTVTERTPDDPKEPWSEDGRALLCKRIVAKGQQHFFDHNGGNRMNLSDQPGADSTGTFELYLFQTNAHFLLVGWRFPNAIEKEFPAPKPAELAALSVSSVRALPVAETKSAASDKGAKK